ncbi:MAG: hypothetical protein A4E28_00864 [Methanocella sp. PtaU1.Bin125]|nr:MAG: hypothetical protein A4E28_00864 [Methanocella sp. PtaU1.Bin125]
MQSRGSLNFTIVAAIALLSMLTMLFIVGMASNNDSGNVAETTTTAPAPVTEETGPNWSWLLLLILVPLTGFVMYYYEVVKGV